MKKEYLFVLAGLLLAAIAFSVIQLTMASPDATNPGHPASGVGGTDIADRTFQNADYSFPGNLGIGTTTPAQTLTIQGTSTTPIFGAFASSSAPVLYLTSNGNVGMGTTTPEAQLHIYVAPGASALRINTFKVKPISATSTGVYDSGENLIMIFDEGN